MTVATACCLLAGSLTLADTPAAPKLPSPTGPLKVGTTIFRVVDPTRPDLGNPSARRPREFMAQAWYPAGELGGARRAPYVPDPALLAAMKKTGYYLQSEATIDVWKAVATDAWLDAPPVSSRPPLPVLLFSHGLGLSRVHYTGLARDLASHGYAVVCIDHPYGGLQALPDGRVLSTSSDPSLQQDWQQRTEDCARDMTVVLDHLEKQNKAGSGDRFSGKLNLRHGGVLGHSMGGAAAFACQDPRVAACADLDGAPLDKTVKVGVGRPALLLRSKPEYSDAELAAKGRTRAQMDQQGEKMNAIWKRLFAARGQPHFNLSLRGTGHMSFGDAPFVMPDTITRFGGRITPFPRTHEILTRLLRTFFDRYVQDRSDLRIEEIASTYPEVIVNP